MSPGRIIGGLLLGSAAVGVAWLSYLQSIASFEQREQAARGAITNLHERLIKARAAVQEVRVMESEAQTVRRQMDQLRRDLPEGSAIVWMPKLIKAHFAAFGLNATVVRLNTVREEPELSGFCRGFWSVALPMVKKGHSAQGSLLAVAEFEQQHPFVKVLDFAIRPDPENPQQRIALLNVAALIRK